MLRDKLSLLPDAPGCYLMKDKNGTIIYVGKAKNLKNRVRSYFNSAQEGKTLRLVSEIVDFEYIITNSELEAFVLEINLIKEHDPKYNIMLTDDKTYPFIQLTDEVHPRLLVVRNVKKKRGKIFGPYPNVIAARETVNLLNQIYPLRKCENIPKKECLYYHIGRCLAPCIKRVEKETYDEIGNKIVNFLKGDYKDVLEELTHSMQEAAESLNFERAKEYRDVIEHIKATVEKQKMHLNDFKNRDVFGYSVDKGWMCVQVFYMRGGKLIERKANMFPLMNEPVEDFLTFVGTFYLNEDNIKPSEIVLPAIDSMYLEALDLKVVTPTKGDKKKLVDLATKNAEVALSEKFSLLERDEEKTIGAIESLGRILNMDTPYRIEAFDNSNIMGTSAVSAMVCFIDGKPAKKEYRKYKIKTVEGPDDYASMREVIYRRYYRVLMDQLPKPDLIVIDGGKGQINAAREVINELGLHINVVGLKKDDKHRTSDLMAFEPLQEVTLPRNSNEFYLLQRIQDEVHRFAITFHQKVRSKSTFSSVLVDIEGIGEVRKKKLLSHFKSMKQLKEASVEEIATVVPLEIAKNIKDKLNI